MTSWNLNLIEMLSSLLAMEGLQSNPLLTLFSGMLLDVGVEPALEDLIRVRSSFQVPDSIKAPVSTSFNVDTVQECMKASQEWALITDQNGEES